MSGTGSLTKEGTGTFTLGAGNTYTGGTFVNAGTLALGASNALADTGSINVSGGTLAIGGFSDTVGAVAVTDGSITGTGTLTGSSYLIHQSAGTATVSARLAGAGSLTKSGAGTLVLTGSQSYTGATTVSGGSLVFTNNAVPTTSGFSGTGSVTIQPDTSFSSALNSNRYSYATTLSGLTLGKNGNTAGMTIGSAISIGGPIAVYGGLVTLSADLTSTATSGNGIDLNGQRITQGAGIQVSTSGAHIVYSASGGAFTSGEDTAISLGATTGSRAVINAGGGNISLSGSFGATGVIGGSNMNDFAIWLAGSDIKTSGSGTITITGDATNTTGIASDYGINLVAGTLIQSQTGAITLTGTGSKASANARGVVVDGQAIKILSASGAIRIRDQKPAGLTGTYTGFYLRPSSTGHVVIGSDGSTVLSGSSTASSSNITIEADAATFVANESYGTQINTSGAVTLQPDGNDFVGTLDTTNLTLASTLSSLSIGKASSADGTADAAVTLGSVTSINGPITVYGGNININAGLVTSANAVITLKGSGNVTDGPSGYVQAGSQTTLGERTGSLLLLGGSVTLDNSANNDVYNLAASGVSGLTFLDYGGLDISTVASTSGVSATGVVNIGTQIGSLRVSQNVATTNASANALTLNASIGSSVGADLLSNILISSTTSYTPTISVGAGGIGRLYTGGITSDNQRLSQLSSLTPGYFRYNADETTDFATAGLTALGAGINVIYREQPSATVTVANKSMTYGDAIPILTGSVSGAVNGDNATYSVTGRLNASSGNIRVGSYTLTETGLAGLGYNVTVAYGALTVGQKSLMLTGLRASDKTYNRETAASIASYGALSGVVSGTVAGSQVTDAVTLVTSGASSTFSDYNAGANKTVTVSGLSLTGTDAANYSIGSQTTTATIKQAPLTISGITAASRAYDATDTATADGSKLSLGGLIAEDAGAVTVTNITGKFDSKHVGTGKTVTLSYTKGGAALGNYSVTDQTSTIADITKATLTLAGATGVSKTYDGTSSTASLVLDGTSTPAPAVGSLGGILGTDTVTLTGSAVFASADVARSGDAITGTVTTQAINQGTIALAGADAGNYNLSWTPGSGTIHPAPLTVYANNDAKFVSTSDPTFSVSYAGFVAGQTASALDTTPTVSVDRTNALPVSGGGTRTLGASGAELADVYTDALVPGGATAKNYSFNYVKGSYAIVPADQLLVRMAPVSTVYGTAASYAVSSAKYFGQTGAAKASVSSVGASGEITGVQVTDAADKFVVGDEVNVISATGTGARLRVDSITGNGSIATLSVVSAGSGYAASDELNLQYSREVSVTSAVVGNKITLTDMGGQTAQFNLAPTAAALSTAGKLKAGNYQLGADGLVTETSPNFSNVVTVVGNHTVTPKALTTSVTAGAAKTYDGTRAMVGLTLGLTGIETGTNNDVVNASGTGTYDVDKNASTSKAYTVTGITLGGTDAGNYYLWDGTTATSTLTGTGAIGKRTLNVTYTGVNKVYDGNSTAKVITSDDRVAGDKLTLAYQANFASMNSEAAKDVYRVAGVVTDKNISIASASLTGSDDDGNYTVVATGTATAAKITPASLVISGIVGVDKTYNNDATALLNTAGLTATGLMVSDTFGVEDANTVRLTASGAFGDVNAGLGKAVSITSSYSGIDAGNYIITSQTGTTASIAKRQVMVTASNGVSKTYDGTTDMTGVTIGLGAVNGVTESGLVSGDSVDVSGTGSFSSASVSRDANGNVLSDKTYTLSDLQLSGTNAANYMIAGGATSVTGNNGRIDPKTLTLMGFDAASKVYDGTTAATIISAGTLDGVVGADDVSASNTGAAFSNKNVADGKTVTLNGIALVGLQAGNYSIAATATDTANITAKALTISGLSSSDKVYDGTTTATVNGTAALQSFQVTGTGNSSDGIAYIGDVVSVTGTAVGNFNSKDVASANTVAFTGLSLTGGDAGNYTLTQHANDNAPRITPKALTISGLSSSNKVYDGTTTATVNGTAALQSFQTAGTGSSSDGIAYTGDTVNLSGSAVGNFNSKDVATANTVAFTGLSLTGGDAGNYTLTQHADDNTPRITAKALTISGLSSSNKVYDGTTTATVNGTVALQTFQSAGSGNSSDGVAYIGDSVSLNGTAVANFNSKNVSAANTVAFTGLSLTGGDAGNYTLTQHADAQQVITTKALTVTANVVSKVYDGTLGTSGTTGTVDTSALVSGDVVNSAGTQAFTNKNQGTGKTVRASGVTIKDASNADMTGNYDITYVDDNSSTITQLASATWVGGTTGDWFNPLNWASTSNLAATGAVPDLANVAEVVITAGATVSFNATASGLAEANQPVFITALQGSGATLNVSAGSLNIGSSGITLGGLAQTGGDIVSAGSVSVVNAFNQSAGTLGTTGVGSHISLTQATGDLAWVSISSSGNLTVNSAGKTSLGTTTVGGDLSSTTRGAGTLGGVVQTGALTVAGHAQFIAHTGTGQDALLNHGSNDFQGAVSFTNANSGSWRDVTLVDVNTLTLGDINASGKLDATAATNLTVDGTINVQSLDLTATSGDITQGAGGTLTVTQGPTNLLAGDNITLDGANDFTGTVNATGNNITLSDQSDITLGDINAGGDLIVDAGGNIDQDSSSGKKIVVGGNTDLSGGDITLDGPGNDFQGTVNADGDKITLKDENDITLGNIDAGGDLIIDAGGNIDQDSSSGNKIVVGGNTDLSGGDITLDGPGNDFQGTVNADGDKITLKDENDITLGNIDAGGELIIDAGGNIDQDSSSGNKIVVGGNTDLSGGDITLDGPSNDFKGTVNADGEKITLSDENDITLGDINAGGDLIVDAAGNIDQDNSDGKKIVVGGNSDFSGGGDITLDGPSNDFKGTVNADGKKITLKDENDITLGNIDAGGDLIIDAGGNIDQDSSDGKKIVVGGNTDLSGGDITLDGPRNDFKGTVNVDGEKITLKDENDITLGNIDAGGDLIVGAGGNIDQDSSDGKKIVVEDKTQLTARGNIKLDGKENKFTKGVTVFAPSYIIVGDSRKDVEDAQGKAITGLQVAALPGTGSLNNTPPQALVMSSDGPSGSSATTASTASSGTGVSVDLLSTNQQDTPLMVAVSLPKGASTVGSGFSFEMPDSVKSMAGADADVQISQVNGSPLPAWLKFDRQAMRFEANAVPDSALPLQLWIVVGGQRVTVVISERTE